MAQDGGNTVVIQADGKDTGEDENISVSWYVHRNRLVRWRWRRSFTSRKRVYEELTQDEPIGNAPPKTLIPALYREE
jgi:hypothetical protein